MAYVLVAAVVAMLLAERVAITLLTRSQAGRDWVRRHRWLHPNSISLIRIPMGALSVALWLAGWPKLAILWFSFWMITDLTDGTIARNCDLGTETGKWLDPLSDKCMYFPALLFFCRETIPVNLSFAWVVVVLTVDSLGQLSRLVSRKKAANYFGKAKTALITIVISLAALHHLDPLPFMSSHFLYLLTISCALLAFLSVYCKVIPDEWYANSLTLANFLCGLAAVWALTRHQPLRAFVLVFMGQFFDLFDGRLARKYGSTRHGAIFDDIADGTTFGVAIGYLVIYQVGGWLGITVAALYVVATIYRLYRFLHPSEPLPDGIFEGLPSPAGALLAGSAALVFAPSVSAVFAGSLRWLTPAFVLAAAALMISHIRYRHFGRQIWPDVPRMVKLLCFIFFVVFVNFSIANRNYGELFPMLFFVLANLYVVYGWESSSADVTDA